jgi:hypothetical protein
VAVAGIPLDETFVLEIRERSPQGLAGDPEAAGERRESATAGAADLREDGQRPAVMTEGDEA